METRLRLLIVLAGLPEPEVNHEVRDDYGNLRMRFDLSYPAIRLIIEYDGRQHAESAAQWLHDVKRREQLDEGQWRIVIVTSEGIYRSPATTVERVWRALKERGWRGLPARRAPAEATIPHVRDSGPCFRRIRGHIPAGVGLLPSAEGRARGCGVTCEISGPGWRPL